MRKTKSMNGEMIEYLVDTYSTSIIRLAYSYTSNMQDAEDVVQEVFTKLIQKRPDFKDENHIKAWLIRVTINTSINLVKSIKKKGNVPLEENISYYEKEKDTLVEQLKYIPDKYNAVLYLYYYEGYEVKEIATILNKRTSTIYTLLDRGRDILKRHLEKEEWQI